MFYKKSIRNLNQTIRELKGQLDYLDSCYKNLECALNELAKMHDREYIFSQYLVKLVEPAPRPKKAIDHPKIPYEKEYV